MPIDSPALGVLADEIFELRTQRLALAKKVDDLKSQEKNLQERILLALQQQGLTSARGQLATVAERRVTRFSVVDWDVALDWIASTGAIELLERRVNQTVCRELTEGGEKIAGVDAIEILELSITKKGAR